MKLFYQTDTWDPTKRSYLLRISSFVNLLSPSESDS